MLTCKLRLRTIVTIVTKSCLTLRNPMDAACQAPLSMGFPRQEYWVGCHFFLHAIFPIQELNMCLLLGRQTLPLSSSYSFLQILISALIFSTSFISMNILELTSFYNIFVCP